LLARLIMLAEQAWAALFYALMAAGVLLLLMVSGAALLLPPLARLALVAGLIALGLWSARGLLKVRLPGEEEALARLERESGLAHQPLRALRDELALPREDEAADRLWRAHRARLKEQLRTLRAGAPRSDLARRDPFALRFALMLALIVAFALNGAQYLKHWPRLFEIPAIGGGADSGMMLDAWLDPPAFTGTPPIVLARQGKAMHTGQPLKVPGNTKLILRFAGESRPVLRLYALDPQDAAWGRRLHEEGFSQGERGQWRLSRKLTRPVGVEVKAGWTSWRWMLDVAPDLPPVIAMTEKPAHTLSGQMVLKWLARDDHGVRAATVRVELAEPKEGMLQFAPPEAPLRAPAQAQKVVKGADMLKFAAHPWAGMKARLILRARDVAGQTGQSRPYSLVLPMRAFSKPLARALIEQRKALVLNPRRHRKIATVLAALIAWPEGLIEKSGHYLGIRHAVAKLAGARTDAEKKEVVALLWNLAEDIEDGDIAAARRRLEAARKALEQALRNGASEEEIARRIEELKQAMNQFLSALARRQGDQPPRQAGVQAQARAVTPQQLRQMMRQLEELARSGARRQAQEMLAQLDQLLQSLQTRPQMAGPPSPQEQAMGALQQMMRRQQQLMDKTWQAEPGRQQPPPEPGQGEGARGQQQQQQRQGSQQSEGEPQRAPGMGQLQRQQRQLAEQLGQMMDKLGRAARGDRDGRQGMQALKRAQEAMKGAAQALGKGERRDALKQQRQALQAMRQGMRALARQVARQRGGSGVRMGRRRYDPLGRPTRGPYAEPGPNENMVPDASAAQRARRILEQLRRKAEDATRPALERQYIDRLLRGLF